MPAIDTPLIVGRRGYHIRTGSHNLTPYDWDRYADFADRVWKAPAGRARREVAKREQ
jgi:(4-O-methyl)-D-glucuronate---lignin esterase